MSFRFDFYIYPRPEQRGGFARVASHRRGFIRWSYTTRAQARTPLDNSFLPCPVTFRGHRSSSAMEVQGHDGIQKLMAAEQEAQRIVSQARQRKPSADCFPGA